MFPSHFRVTQHTQYIEQGSTFYAFAGAIHTGTSFIEQALDRGATTIVAPQGTQLPDHVLHRIQEAGVQLKFSSNPRKDFAEACAQAYDDPAQKLHIIGITGTKGKTTTTLVTAHLLAEAGYKTACLSTVRNAIGEAHIPAPKLTTQQADYIHAFLATCVTQGITHVVMEVAAQAVSSYRTHGIAFDSIIFTNFSPEHGEYYATQEDYFQAKCDLLKQLKSNGTLILNADDASCKRLQAEAARLGITNIKTCSNQEGDIVWRAEATTTPCLKGSIAWHNHVIPVANQYVFGAHNLANSASACAAIEQICDPHMLSRALATFKGIPGRGELYTTKTGVHVCIDHAHTPSSFECILSTCKELSEHVTVVFGCGGDRERTKRPVMTAIAEKYSNTLYITSDNPRTESLEQIIKDMLSGCSFAKPIHIITDREEAIKHAIAHAPPRAIVALLGKGIERAQIVGTQEIAFHEYAIVEKYFGYTS